VVTRAKTLILIKLLREDMNGVPPAGMNGVPPAGMTKARTGTK
jgi:hypothetical protein